MVGHSEGGQSLSR